MSDEIDPGVLQRAREIFEREAPPDEAWGTVTPDGTVAYTFTERGNPSAPMVGVIGEDKRARYIERAREELKADKTFANG